MIKLDSYDIMYEVFTCSEFIYREDLTIPFTIHRKNSKKRQWQISIFLSFNRQITLKEYAFFLTVHFNYDLQKSLRGKLCCTVYPS